MQGIPAYDFLCRNDPSCAWPSITSEQDFVSFKTNFLSDRKIRHLAGNAMHKPSVGCVVLYALSRAMPHMLFSVRFSNVVSALELEQGPDEDSCVQDDGGDDGGAPTSFGIDGSKLAAATMRGELSGIVQDDVSGSSGSGGQQVDTE